MYLAALYSFALNVALIAEPVRALLVGATEVSLDNPAGNTIPLIYNNSVIISLHNDTRFFRGIEFEVIAPPAFLLYRGSLAFILYAELNSIPEPGIVDVQAEQIAYELLPNKLQSVYQVPTRPGHGLRTTPYISVPTGVIAPALFPLMFRFMPVVKGFPEEFESLVFLLNVKPIISDEGAVQMSFHIPEQLPDKSFVVLIDDRVIDSPDKEQILKEGEHHLIVLSEDYRNENIQFVVERGKTYHLDIELHDTTPVIIFEAPENVVIYLDNELVINSTAPHPVEPGTHEVRFQVSDYTVIRPVQVQKGKSYRVALTVDVHITENN
jgi:hypothetical protein